MTEYASAHDLDLVEVYRDGASGRTTDRQGLDALRQRVGEGYIDRVIVFSLSRFGRSVRDTFNLLDEMEAHGCYPVFLEPMVIDTSESTPMTTILLSLLSALAQIDSETKAVAVRAGMEESASQGKWQGGPVPFGYQTDDNGFLVPDPTQAEAIQEAVEMILEGHSTAEVAKTLNAIGHKTPRGGQWRSAEVRRHLRREAIKGVARWDKGGDEIEINFDPIIEPPVWDRLQQVLDKTALSRSHSEDVWTLSGRVTCSCGGTLVAAGRRDKDKRIRYYRCNRHQGDRSGLCQCDHDQVPMRPRWWNADELEAEAWRLLVWTLQSRDALEEVIDRHLGNGDDGFDEVTLQRVRHNAERLRQALIEAEADLYTSDDRERHKAVIESLEGRRKVAETERDRLEAMKRDQERSSDLKQRWLAVAESYVAFDGADAPSPEEQREIYADLDVTFDIGLHPRYSGSLAYKARGLDPKAERAYLPFSGYINIRGLTLPSELLYDASTMARPFP